VSKISVIDKSDGPNKIEEEDRLDRKQLFAKLKKIMCRQEVLLNQK